MIRWAGKGADGGWVFGEDEEDVLDMVEIVEGPIRLPTLKEVCSRCRGKGTHDHPAFSNGITSDEWAEWDADEREDYRAGVYDVTCTVCEGLNVVDVLDDAAIERRDPELLKALLAWRDEMADLRATEEAERRMGA